MNKYKDGTNGINIQGLKMWIKEYRKYSDIDVEFEDGYISYHRTCSAFSQGKISNKNFKINRKTRNNILINRVGETNYNNQGLKMIIINYRGCKDIDIEFEDGFISYNRDYTSFKLGTILNSNYKHTKTLDKTGEVNYNFNGNKMTIIEYNGCNDITIQFKNGYKRKTVYAEFKKGNIKNPYDKMVYGIGYLGEGKYIAGSKIYEVWKDMIDRCYNENKRLKNPTYNNVTVCNQWHNFQNFAKWYEENYYEVNDEIMCLDKDILHKDNKLYSPENCIIVPYRINLLFVKADASRGEYPIGVSKIKNNNEFQVHCKDENKNQKYLGRYTDYNIAFNVYKKYKEEVIKKVAEQYKNRIPTILYEALYKYEVEITD